MNHFKSIILCTLSTYLLVSCGTLGHIQFYNFDKPKQEVEEKLLSVINNNSIYIPPHKWNDYEDGADTTRDIFIFFKSEPKELYQVGFAYKESWAKSPFCELALVGVFDGKLWHFENDLSSKEQERMKTRLETEILSKMGIEFSKGD